MAYLGELGWINDPDDRDDEITSLRHRLDVATKALTAIEALPCGVPGHSVAVPCGGNHIAFTALKEIRHPKEDV